MTRGFQVVNQYKNQNIQLPQRSTEGSAGYDIRSAQTITIPSYYRLIHTTDDNKYIKSSGKFLRWCRKQGLVTLVHTGIKAYYPKDEFLGVFNRSSNPIKRGLILANGVGVIDSDYYNNPSNEGELCAEFINLSLLDYTIHKGDRIMQGVFLPYLLADNDKPINTKRSGGLGSTGKK